MSSLFVYCNSSTVKKSLTKVRSATYLGFLQPVHRL
jgi:hypothetical protein